MFSRVSGRIVASTQKVQTRGAAKGVRVESFAADILPYKGKDTLKRPIKVKLEAGKSYHWCSCGYSAKQPFCDGTHQLNGITMNKPIKFQVEKTGDYVLCGCKHTDSRPICDGTHKTLSQEPASASAHRLVAFGESPVYDGVAHKLGYHPKNGGFQ